MQVRVKGQGQVQGKGQGEVRRDVGRGALVAAVLALVLSLLLPAAAGEPKRGAAQPRPGELNALVLEVLKGIPADGTHEYWWPRNGEGGDFGGSTADVVYDGAVVLKGEPKGRTYCCGLTLEVFVRAWERWCAKRKAPFAIGGLDAAGLRALKSDWFCCGEVRDGPVSALVPRKLGVRIDKLDDARPGDFVQLWRKKGSGHSVVFLGWERKDGEIAALRYWSTQPATRGVGERVERFEGENGLVPEKLYIARAGVVE